MPPIPQRINVTRHPGSSEKEVSDEPDWNTGHQHRVGYKNRRDRIPGKTHRGAERAEEEEFGRDNIPLPQIM